jgi:hypothetical protein
MFGDFIRFEKELLQINENNFDDIAWRLFQFQATHNDVYGTYLSHLNVDPKKIHSLAEIPFLPIRFFKGHEVKTGLWLTQRTFQSSGTTEAIRSTHYLWDESFYLNHAASSFEKLFGPLNQYHILALLPFYDTGQSSLVAMARYFVAKSQSAHSGFFLSDTQSLLDLLLKLKTDSKKVLLLGVSHALLDLAEQGPFSFENILVMETGGMKGRKEEITRAELHDRIQRGLGVESVYSEYGMTELLSQAYSRAKGIFQCTPSMKVIIKEINDPFSVSKSTGLINIIDLANFHSCCFIETQDLGRVTPEGFEVLGRVDNSEARGCNLMLS